MKASLIKLIKNKKLYVMITKNNKWIEYTRLIFKIKTTAKYLYLAVIAILLASGNT